MSDLAKTPLHDWHAAHGGRLVDFAGWSMPVQYTSIIEEHDATRNAAGLFDVSHMGRFKFTGPGAEELLDRLLTRRIAGMGLGKIRYSLVCNEQAGILDDVLAYHLADEQGQPFFGLVVNASNREKIAAWIDQHRQPGDDVEFVDRTTATAMLALQGPKALQIASEVVDIDLPALSYYTGVMTPIAGVVGVVSRTGYTGEDGCELIVPAEAAADLWQRLIDGGAVAVGLGARDTLRLEAAMPLYGHELSETIDPYQAGLSFAVNLKDRTFIGSQRLTELKQQPGPLERVGLQLEGRRVPREHYPILLGEESVGEVTSGTFSPTLGHPIAMAYVNNKAAEAGTVLTVDIRGRQVPARVVKLPFYAREN